MKMGYLTAESDDTEIGIPGDGIARWLGIQEKLLT
jgi:hypothetical protein